MWREYFPFKGVSRTYAPPPLQFMPTEDVEEDIQNLGEQICDILVHMHLPKLSELFVSQTQTLVSLLTLIQNAAMFAEDCSKLEFIGVWYSLLLPELFLMCTHRGTQQL